MKNNLCLGGSLLAERLLRPQQADRFVTEATCFQWNHGIALIGRLYGGPTRRGWLATLDEQPNVKWETLDNLYGSTDVITAAAGAFFIVNTNITNPSGGATSILKIGPNGEVLSRYVLSDNDNPQLVYPVSPRSDLRVALLEDTLKIQIVGTPQ